MEIREAARRFVRTWERGWASHDVELILSLYAEDCRHRSMPFRPVHRGRQELADYIRWSFEDERVESVRFGDPLVDGDTAVAEFVVLSSEDGGPVTLAGCVIVRFDPAGFAVESRDYWHVAQGHVSLG
ncbi:nuclear transport factor 2 family protein [Planotetraspora kaengkrachanensis]|uniref:SnoaL-like domain-containing protein n=1 Tax=Planotetraspora kaengkrachanensis TaxID=575193 RepID=A0A8J3M2J3_9ACTN|nr:nuclear transport factor 2 family protein [Planotetraspora kaengkrachanensis]GIG78174.1 hypothetical protein Pka01_13010 [Planotetraspora kaengkrachanensis]